MRSAEQQQIDSFSRQVTEEVQTFNALQLQSQEEQNKQRNNFRQNQARHPATLALSALEKLSGSRYEPLAKQLNLIIGEDGQLNQASTKLSTSLRKDLSDKTSYTNAQAAAIALWTELLGLSLVLEQLPTYLNSLRTNNESSVTDRIKEFSRSLLQPDDIPTKIIEFRKALEVFAEHTTNLSTAINALQQAQPKSAAVNLEIEIWKYPLSKFLNILRDSYNKRSQQRFFTSFFQSDDTREQQLILLEQAAIKSEDVMLGALYKVRNEIRGSRWGFGGRSLCLFHNPGSHLLQLIESKIKNLTPEQSAKKETACLAAYDAQFPQEETRCCGFF